MAVCDAACSVTTPTAVNTDCGITTRQGGINRVIFMACDESFTDPTDQLEWDGLITANKLVVSPLIVGSKPKGSFTKKRVSSCSPERVVAGEKTLAFQDYNTDATAGNTTHIDFYNAICEAPEKWRLFYVTCDGWLYGAIDSIVLEIDEIIEDNNLGNAYIDGIISWNSTKMETPTYIPNIVLP